MKQLVRDRVCCDHKADRVLCGAEGCGKLARDGRVCVRHGAKVTRGRFCDLEGCTNQVVN